MIRTVLQSAGAAVYASMDAPNVADIIFEHAFKAEVYRSLPAVLFIESNEKQASEIAFLTGKPVVCTATQTLAVPHVGIKPLLRQQIARSLSIVRRKLIER